MIHRRRFIAGAAAGLGIASPFLLVRNAPAAACNTGWNRSDPMTESVKVLNNGAFVMSFSVRWGNNLVGDQESRYSSKLNVGESATINLRQYYDSQKLCIANTCYVHVSVVMGFDVNSKDFFTYVLSDKRAPPAEYKVEGTIWNARISRR